MNKKERLISKRHKFLSGFAAVFCGLALIAGMVLSGNLTTDNLTVYRDSALYGNLEVKDDVESGSAPTNGVLLYYSLNTNATPVPDDSGNGHTGTVYSATWITNGITGGAYTIGDGSHYISIEAAAISGVNTGSVSFWVYLTTSSDQQFLNRTSVGENISIQFRTGGSASKLMAYMGTYSNLVSIVADQSTSLNQWIFVVFTWQMSSGSIYMNGQLIKTQTDGSNRFYVPSTAGSFWIGRDTRTTYDYQTLQGSMDEIRFYNRVLTTNEIEGLYFNDAHLTAGYAQFQTGIKYVKRLGDVSMGIYTNQP